MVSHPTFGFVLPVPLFRDNLKLSERSNEIMNLFFDVSADNTHAHTVISEILSYVTYLFKAM